MTTPPPAPVEASEITQGDREAAWPFRADCYGSGDKAGWDRGKYDHVRAIQAFAKARLAAIAAIDGPPSTQLETPPGSFNETG